MPLKDNQEHSNPHAGSDNPLLTADGTGIKWAALAEFVVGIFAVEFWGGLAGFIARMFDAWLINPLDAAATWVGQQAYSLAARPAGILRLAFGSGERWLRTHPSVAIFVALLLVLALAFVASRVVPRA